MHKGFIETTDKTGKVKCPFLHACGIDNHAVNMGNPHQSDNACKGKKLGTDRQDVFTAQHTAVKQSQPWNKHDHDKDDRCHDP